MRKGYCVVCFSESNEGRGICFPCSQMFRYYRSKDYCKFCQQTKQLYKGSRCVDCFKELESFCSKYNLKINSMKHKTSKTYNKIKKRFTNKKTPTENNEL